MAGLCALAALSSVANTANEAAEGTVRPPGKHFILLGEIVVAARQVERNPLATPNIEAESLNIAASVVEGEAIRAQNAGNLAEAIDMSTGVFTETRGRKEKNLSSFRGQIYPYPDFAINGVWQRSFWEVPSFFPAAAIGRIEMLRSGGAIMTGPNAGLVGVINVVPRRFDQQTTLLDLQGGSYGAIRSSAVHGNRLPGHDYTIGISGYSTDGPEHENAAERFGTLFGTWGWAPSEDLSLDFTGYGLTGKRELRRIQDPGRKDMQRWTEEFSPYTSYGGVLRALLTHDDYASTSLDLGGVLRSADYSRRVPNQPDTEHLERDWEYNAGVIHARSLIDDNVLRLGFQYNRWTCPDGKRYFVGKRMDVDTLSVVVMNEHEWDRLVMNAGARLTRAWYRDYTDTTFNITGDRLSGHRIENEWGDPALTGTMGAGYRLDHGMMLYAHAAMGSLEAPPGAVSETDAPLDREGRLILDGGISVENPALGSAKLGLFAAMRENAVLLTDTRIDREGEFFNTYANADIRHYGLEMEWRSAELLNVFTLFGNATAMNSKRSDGNGWTSYGEIPDIIASAGMSAAAGRYDISLFGKYVSRFENKRFAEDGEYHDLGEFVDLNLTMGAGLGRDRATRIRASLKNLLNDKYSTVIGYPDYGFQAFIGLEHRM